MEMGIKKHEGTGYGLAGTGARRLRRLAPSVLLLLSVAVGASAADKEWTGNEENGRWESPGNWEPRGVPGEDDDVCIPADSGDITTNGRWKKVRSLDVKNSTGDGTTIKSRDNERTSTKITASGDIKIGERNKVCGKDGKRFWKGGNVKIKSTGGKVTNNGDLRGGDGGDGIPAKKGGDVEVTGIDVENNGTETGGKGGTRDNPGKGGAGGNVTNTATNGTVNTGTKTGGEGGDGNPDPDVDRGNAGTVASFGMELVLLDAGDRQKGATIAISTGPGGTIRMIGLQHGAFVADESIFINAGGPENPIEMFDIEPGAVVFQAVEQICIHGQVFMHGGRSLEEITEPDAFVSPEPCLPPPDSFLEQFDSYDPGDVCDQGGWEEWDGSSDVCGQVTDVQWHSGIQSLRLDALPGSPGDDTVHRFGIVGGVWDFKAHVFVPDDATGEAFVILLNQYPAEDWNNWSLQIAYDAYDRVLYNRNDPTQSTPMVTGVWTELSARIDLDNDVVEVTYEGHTFVTDRSWRNGVAPGGEPWIQAIDLYAGEPNGGGISEIFFDDVSLIEFLEVLGACCMDEEGFCEDLVLQQDCAEWGGRFSEETICPDLDPPCGESGGCVRDPQWECDGDVDGDGQVNPVDSGLVQSKFGSTIDQDLCNFDIDCDGQINPVDAGIVQSLFGTCEPVRAECP